MDEVNGLVNSVQRVPRGSELTVAATSGTTVLSVDSTEDFDDAGGDLDINGVRYVYTSSDLDADTITLASPGLTASAAVGDGVYLVIGGQIATDHIAYVSLGEGDEAEVIIPFADRPIWPEGDMVDPVPVVLSSDLTSIESVPARVAVIDGTQVINAPALSTDVRDGYQVIILGTQVVVVSVPGGVIVAAISSTGISTLQDVHGNDLYADSLVGASSTAASITSQGRVARTPSTLKVKRDVVPLDLEVARTVLELVPVTYRRKPDAHYPDEVDDTVYPGFIAEQAAEVGADLWVTRDMNGEPDGFRYAELTAALVAMVKEQRDQIADLTARLDAIS